MAEDLGELASWSFWVPWRTALGVAPDRPGVYLARQGTGPVVYVGMGGERKGQGLRGRLRKYAGGLASGLAEAALDQALADPAWLQDRLAEAQAGQTARIREWGRAALDRARIELCWTTTATTQDARATERRILLALHDQHLWNRSRPRPPAAPSTRRTQHPAPTPPVTAVVQA